MKTPLLAVVPLLAFCPSGFASEAQSIAPGAVGIMAKASAERILYDFQIEDNLRGWRIQDDVVMGGRSRGMFTWSKDGYAVFSGDVSLENNGGFSSVQTYFDPIEVSGFRKAFIRLKGDGKPYRFIVESDNADRHYYVSEFTTSNEWQTVEISLAKMYPMRRGDRLDIPNYPGKTMVKISFMIANQRAESFHLQIQKIWLE